MFDMWHYATIAWTRTPIGGRRFKICRPTLYSRSDKSRKLDDYSINTDLFVKKNQ